MEKPFTIQVNDLHLEIIKKLNEAKMPYYVLRSILLDIIKEIDDNDGAEITKYFEEIKAKENSKKGDDK